MADAQIRLGLKIEGTEEAARLRTQLDALNVEAGELAVALGKGELSSAAIDHGWPHQVVLPARVCERDGYNEIHEFCRDLTLCSRGHAL